MADYKTTVGVKLVDDFQQLIADMNVVIAKLDQIKSSMNDLYNKSDGLKKTLNGLNVDNLNKSLREAVAQMDELAKKSKDVNIKNPESNMKGIQNSEWFKLAKIGVTTAWKADLMESKGIMAVLGKTGSFLSTKFQEIKNNIKESSQNMLGLSKNTGAWNEKLENGLSKTLTLGKIYFLYNYTKQLFSRVGEAIKSAMDFTETENYFARAMGSMYDSAMKFQNRLSDVFGLAQQTMMNAQATYKNMLGTFGTLSDNMSEKLSETVTKMTLDYASLYNVDFKDAVTKFQSALAKQVRPIRSTSGYDITTATLQDTANSLGMQRTISQCSELEKRLLIILTLQRQMANSGAMNDFARTIEQPSNQLRILKEQLVEVSRWIGSVFYGVIAKILPYLNAFVMVIKEAIKGLAMLVGYTPPNSSGSATTILDTLSNETSDVSDNINQANDNTKKATKSAKAWRNVLMGFDVANVLPSQDSSSGSSGGSGASGGVGSVGSGFIDPAILNALENYDYIFTDVRMKAMDIRDSILAWLKADRTIYQMSRFWRSIWIDVKKVYSAKNKAFSENLKNIVKNIWTMTGNIYENLANAWNKNDIGYNILFNIATVFENILGIVADITEVLEHWTRDISFDGIMSFANDTTYSLSLMWQMVKATADLMKNDLINFDWVAVGHDIADGLQSVLKVFNDYLDKIDFTKLGTNVSKAVNTVISTLKTLTDDGTINSVISSIFDTINNVINDVRIFLENALRNINWEDLKVVAVNMITAISNGIKSLYSTIGDALLGLIDSINFDAVGEVITKGIVEYLTTKATMIRKIGVALAHAINEAMGGIKPADIVDGAMKILDSILATINEINWGLVKDKLLEGIDTAIHDLPYKEIGKTISDVLVNASQLLADIDWVALGNGIREVMANIDFGTIGWNWQKMKFQITEQIIEMIGAVDWVGIFANLALNIINGFQLVFGGIIEAVIGIFRSMVDHILDFLGIHSPSKLFMEIGEYVMQGFINGLNGLIDGVINFFKGMIKSIKDTFNKENIANSINVGITLVKEKWTTVKDWVSNSIGGTVSSAVALAKSGWSNVRDWVKTYIGGAVSASVSLAKSGWTTVKAWADKAKGDAVSIAVKIGTNVSTLWKNLKDSWKKSVGALQFHVEYATPTNSVMKAVIKALGLKGVPKLRFYANGGTPNMGELFVARERGPELVGQIGNRSAVMNNNQIVQAVSSGVYNAVNRAMSSQNKGGDINITIRNNDGTSIKKTIKDYNNYIKSTGGKGGFVI